MTSEIIPDPVLASPVPLVELLLLADLVRVEDLSEGPEALVPEQALREDGRRPRGEVVPGEGVLAVGGHLRPLHLATEGQDKGRRGKYANLTISQI